MFQIGDKVVHPMHGAGVIDSIVQEKINGKVQDYYVFRMPINGLVLKIPTANSELVGQGLGNIIAPFFGGITATAAIARSAANVRAGATSPISAVIHSILVILALLVLAPLLSWLPLSAMAALLLMVAWNMSVAH